MTLTTDKQKLRCAELLVASYNEEDNRFTDMGELRFGLIDDADTSYLIFPGTRNVQGWLTDLDILIRRTRTGFLAHSGFIDAADKLWDAVSVDAPARDNLIITGHSLGGAIAELFSEYTIEACVTFGCPRNYSRLNVSLPTRDHARYVNGGDPIPHVPDALNFQHPCDQTFLGKGSLLMHLDNHSMDMYYANLQESQRAMVQ